MFPLAGAVTVNDPVSTVKDIPTMRWSIPKACVTVPLRTRTTEEIFAASGVVKLKVLPYEMELGALVIDGRVAIVPSGLNRYAG